LKIALKKNVFLLRSYGHYYTDSMYSPLFYDKELVDKNEYKATKWAFKALINKERLIALSKQNLSKYEISEELGVTEELLDKAYDYYVQN